jgi:ATP-dependent DNA helicase RecG
VENKLNLTLDDDITSLPGVGKKRAEKYAKVGVFTITDLLEYYPRDYVDFTAVFSIENALPDTNVSLKVLITHKPPSVKLRQGLNLLDVKAEDETGKISLKFYNNLYAAKDLTVGEEYYINGKIKYDRSGIYMNSPKFLSINADKTIIPVYRLTEGLTQKGIIDNIKEAIVCLPDEYLPEEKLNKYEFIGIKKALSDIHFPENTADIVRARRRLAFDELLKVELALVMTKFKLQCGIKMSYKPAEMARFEEILPFELTSAQVRAISEITGDMRCERMMNRLLQGDVGSGKTAVAAAAITFAAANGFQSALMAPTEILAKQHFKTLSDILTPLGINVCCLTAAATARETKLIREKIASGEYTAAVGTHSLISDSTEFKNLALVITDEQHRFGVRQRAKLAEKGENVHKLIMSATPIPRTLSLIIYGDLDVTILDELPAGRQPIETFAVTENLRERAFGFIKKELNAGRQAFAVCPAIDSDNDMMSAVRYAEILRKHFPEYRVGLLHGKMGGNEKDEIMEQFKSLKIDILASTSVVEVGVDVPNATVMLIEDADRFGLSQLHQLRGRVGRGAHKSFCILITGNPSPEVRERLKFLSSTTDGFKIAEYDLLQRGAGDFLGSRQHGLPEFKFADITDSELTNETHKFAEELLAQSKDLSDFPLLKKIITKKNIEA